MKLSQLCEKQLKCLTLKRKVYYRKHKHFIDRYWNRDCIIAYKKNDARDLSILIKGVKTLYFIRIWGDRIIRKSEMLVIHEDLGEYHAVDKKLFDNLKKLAVIEKLK